MEENAGRVDRGELRQNTHRTGAEKVTDRGIIKGVKL